jgi:hypothetical protein
MRLIERARRRLRPAVPERLRCNQGVGCPNRAVMFASPVAPLCVEGDEVRRCMAHPPDALAEAVARGERCPVCRRGLWPDVLHLDCGPGGTAGTDRAETGATR